MKEAMEKRNRVFAVCALVGLFSSSLFTAGASPAADKITPEEIVVKHLESIGPEGTRAGIRSRLIQGSVLATVRMGGSGQSRGGAVMASNGEKSLVGMLFGPQEYNNEKMGYDGKKLTLGETKPGVRTNLGGFLLTHDIVFREGLIGGALSSAWPLYDLSTRNPKLKYAGTKKIDDREAYALKYESRKGGNLEIKLFFDTETFRHVRTEYEQTIPPPPVTSPEQAAKQKETHLKMTEDFSDFKTEKGLTLPHTYKLQLTFDTSNNPLLQDWVLTLTKFAFNLAIDDKQFDLSGS